MRVLLTVSGAVPTDLDQDVARGNRPRADYAELARELGADLLDVPAALRTTGWLGRALARIGGPGAVLAWACFRSRRRYDVVFTDGEQVGLPLAALLRLVRERPAHLMVVHRLSVPKKAVLFRALRLGEGIDRMFTYASAQRRFVEEHLRSPVGSVVQTPFMVDTAFFAPEVAPPRRRGETRPLICAAGLERRDYPTMVEAVRDLDVRVVLAAASPWSKQPDSSAGVDRPVQVEVRQLGFVDLRALYAEADVVVVPVVETDFQAGITTILEAMAMAKPIICTRTSGQTDTIIDGVTGVYVPPGDPDAMRDAIERLLADPAWASSLGAAARRWAVEHADIHRYCERLARHVPDHVVVTA
jgi:glycosyltransferase involved in cell wall biosynthesis